METFTLIKRQLHILAICPSNQDNSNSSLNWKNVAITVLIASMCALLFVFFLFGASTYDERSGTFFVFLTAILGVIFYLSFVCQKQRIFHLIDDLDQFLAKRKTRITKEYILFIKIPIES